MLYNMKPQKDHVVIKHKKRDTQREKNTIFCYKINLYKLVKTFLRRISLFYNIMLFYIFISIKCLSKWITSHFCFHMYIICIYILI